MARTTAINPNAAFLLLAVVILGGCATNAALGHWASQPNRDLFQHTAALSALISDIDQPTNPFVLSAEPSRHFHPYWVGLAALARTFGWSVTQALSLAGYLTMAVLAAGIYAFGRTYFRSPWGPPALLVTATLGWSVPISHTGYINIPTLVEGAAYPAALLVGLSLVLWSLVIETFRRPAICLAIAPLVAFMFATHQLGAGLGLIVASSFVLLWPDGSFRSRLLVSGAMLGGLLLSAAWPYFNPFDLLMRAGNPTWENGVHWYRPGYLMGIFLPTALGLFGLLRPIIPGSQRPLLAVLPVLLLGYVSGAFGFLTGTRFAPTAALVLQVGLATILVRLAHAPEKHSDRFKLTVAGVAFGTIVFQIVMLGMHIYPREYRDEARYGDVKVAASQLINDIPPGTHVAAYDVAAWPVVALDQKVLSVPWPEPLILDLSTRQARTKQLFDPSLSREQRQELARAYSVRTLIIDVRFGPKGRWKKRELMPLARQARRVRVSGPMVRLDL